MGRIATGLCRLVVGGVIAVGAWMALEGVASANQSPSDPACFITDLSFSDGTSTAGSLAALGVSDGEHLTATFTVLPACTTGVEVSFATYRAPTATFDIATASQQVLYSSDTGVFLPGTHTLEVDVFGSTGTGGDPADCSPQHDNSQGGGANVSPGPYDPTCDGSASQNGRSTNNNSSKPCAGCVGNADAKNPPGQYPNGNDPNAGYECDRNQGVGQTNPAHTGCQSFQVDLAYGPVIQQLGPGNFYGGIDDDGDPLALIDVING